MKGQLFLRTGVVLLIVGIVMGMQLGATQNFTYAPVHAHLNLASGVLMMLAGIVYNARPDLSSRAVNAHYVSHLLGTILLPIGIYGSIAGRACAGGVVGAGAVLVLLALLLFAFNLFRRVPREAPAGQVDTAQVP